MFQRFFDSEQPYVGYFKFPEDSEVVPGNLVIRKNIIEGQLYRAPKDIIERPDLPFGFNTRKILNATGVFRLKDGKDYELSILEMQVVSYSASQLGFFEVFCKSLIINGQTISLEQVFPEKLTVKIKGLEEWFEKKAVDYSCESNKISVFSEERIIENLTFTDQVTIDLECYSLSNFKYRDIFIQEIVSIVVCFKEKIPFSKAVIWEEKLRQVFSLFFRKQLRVEEVSFFVPKVEKEFFYLHSDSRDFYQRGIKHRNEAIIRYSDSIEFKKLLKNFFHAESRLSRLMETYFQMELNHSLYSENAFLAWVFELDSFIKKGEQKDISKDEAMKGFSKQLINKVKKEDDPLFQKLFLKFYSLSNERAKFYGNSLQTRLITFFENKRFFEELISNNIEEFFLKIIKTRNNLAHPKLNPDEKVLFGQDLYLYQDKLRLIVYCLIMIELGMDEQLLIDRLKSPIHRNTKPLD